MSYVKHAKCTASFIVTLQFISTVCFTFHTRSVVCWMQSSFTFFIFNRDSVSTNSPCPLFYSCISQCMLAINCLQSFSNLFVIFPAFMRNQPNDILCSYFSFIVKIVTPHYKIMYLNKSLYRHKNSFNSHKIHTICTKYM